MGESIDPPSPPSYKKKLLEDKLAEIEEEIREQFEKNRKRNAASLTSTFLKCVCVYMHACMYVWIVYIGCANPGFQSWSLVCSWGASCLFLLLEWMLSSFCSSLRVSCVLVPVFLLTWWPFS